MSVDFGLRVYVHPMISNTRNLAGDSGLTIPVSYMAAIPEWHFYFGIPDEWAKLEPALEKVRAVKNVTLVPQTYFGKNRNLNNEFLDLPSLIRFADNGPCDVDIAWFFVPEVIPAWKAFGKSGYGQDEKPKKVPVIATCFNGLRQDPGKNNFATVTGQAMGFLHADYIFWECDWIRDLSLKHFSDFLNERALERIRRKSLATGQGIWRHEYEPFPPVKNEKFTIALNHKLIAQKGVDETFRVFDEFYKMVGNQFEVWVFDQSSRTYKVKDRPYVVLKDGSKRDEYLSELSKCHVLVSHSRWDAWGRSYLDCMLFGMPFLCKRDMAFIDMVYPGYEWHFSNNTEVLGYLRYFMENRDEALRVGSRLREWVLDNYTIEAVVEHWRKKSIELVADDVPPCSEDRAERILLVAKKLWDKQGPFTKMDFERAHRRLYGHGTAGDVKGNATKTRRVLLREYIDDVSKPVPTYIKRGA